jgi:hypothetical protein
MTISTRVVHSASCVHTSSCKGHARIHKDVMAKSPSACFLAQPSVQESSKDGSSSRHLVSPYLYHLRALSITACRLRAIHDVCQSWLSQTLDRQSGRLGTYACLNKLRCRRNRMAGFGPGYSMYDACYYCRLAPMVYSMSSGSMSRC